MSANVESYCMRVRPQSTQSAASAVYTLNDRTIPSCLNFDTNETINGYFVPASTTNASSTSSASSSASSIKLLNQAIEISKNNNGHIQNLKKHLFYPNKKKKGTIFFSSFYF